MATKIIRFARVKNQFKHYAGYYPIPQIARNDRLRFMTKTLDITVRFSPAASALFKEQPQSISVKKGRGVTLTARSKIALAHEIQMSNITFEAIDWDDQTPINFKSTTCIDPCE